MGLFGAKKDCELCGGKVGRILSYKTSDGHVFCADCGEKTSKYIAQIKNFTLDQVKEFIRTKEANDVRYANEFKATRCFDFDEKHKMIAVDDRTGEFVNLDEKNPTIFRFDQIRRFRVRMSAKQMTETDVKKNMKITKLIKYMTSDSFKERFPDMPLPTFGYKVIGLYIDLTFGDNPFGADDMTIKMMPFWADEQDKVERAYMVCTDIFNCLNEYLEGQRSEDLYIPTKKTVTVDVTSAKAVEAPAAPTWEALDTPAETPAEAPAAEPETASAWGAAEAPAETPAESSAWGAAAAAPVAAVAATADSAWGQPAAESTSSNSAWGQPAETAPQAQSSNPFWDQSVSASAPETPSAPQSTGASSNPFWDQSVSASTPETPSAPQSTGASSNPFWDQSVSASTPDTTPAPQQSTSSDSFWGQTPAPEPAPAPAQPAWGAAPAETPAQPEAPAQPAWGAAPTETPAQPAWGAAPAETPAEPAAQEQSAWGAAPAEASAEPANDAIETVKKLKGLLDIGALTQEEFDAKKKEILGL